MTGYPRWFLAALLVLLLTVLLSGLVLAPTTLALRAAWDPPWRLAGGDRVWVAALHSSGALVLAATLGALWAVHMRSGWRRGKQRISGTLLVIALMLLAATAIGLYYIGDDRAGAAAAFVHLGAGLVATAAFGWHWTRAKALRRQ